MVVIEPVRSTFKCAVLDRIFVGQMAIVFLGKDVVTSVGRSFDFPHLSRIALVTASFYFVFVDYVEEIFVSEIVKVIVPIGIAFKAAFHVMVCKSEVVGNEMRFTGEAGFKSCSMKFMTEGLGGACVVVFVVQDSEI